MKYKNIIALSFIALATSYSVAALQYRPNATSETINQIYDAFKNGSPVVEFRLRHEHASEDGLKTGYANTLRSIIGYETSDAYDTRLNMEMTNVSAFFTRKYNPNVDGLRKAEYTVVSDPKGAGVTQFNLAYKGIQNTSILLGRQYINLDTQRYVSSVNFRQYPQSFDDSALD